MGAQFFKGDDLEQKFYNSGAPIAETLSAAKTEFYDDAYACFVLGELLWDTNRAPLARAIKREIFRESFSAIFDSFVFAGSFESYLTVFRAIFGPDVDVTFTVPGPGKLNIDIEAEDLVLSPFIVRSIVDDSYVFDHIVTETGDRIVFQTIKGMESQYELEQMLFEMVPAGIYTQITLTLGGT